MNNDVFRFEIGGDDLVKLKKFRRRHEACFCGSAGDKYVYEFIPTGLGTVITVTCSCGKKLGLGDFWG